MIERTTLAKNRNTSYLSGFTDRMRGSSLVIDIKLNKILLEAGDDVGEVCILFLHGILK